MKTDAQARFAPTHEWARKGGDELIVGISDHAQHSLGDIVYVDLPKVGTVFAGHAVFGVVESVKAASDVYLPVGGKITAVNDRLAGEPGLINQDCYGEGWLVRLLPDNPGEWETLLSPGEYEKTVQAEEEK
ncbi:MAG: glycine cleavage system protein GcvH [Spirochaetaceae bacterium]|jgi:glycine cleavage system H protein|nr:glycine cleavage system protein GcvH [Spirochaetaceae bacterium]